MIKYLVEFEATNVVFDHNIYYIWECWEPDYAMSEALSYACGHCVSWSRQKINQLNRSIIPCHCRKTTTSRREKNHKNS